MSTPEPTRIRVIQPGWCTTVQDLGRRGFQQYGVSVSGAMDRVALVIANRLVNNRDASAALEITLVGPELLFEHHAVLAIAGADLSPAVDGRSIPLWTALAISAGSRLTFGPRQTGARSYLAVAGGFDVPLLWGSRSTHLPTGTGGLNGRALAADDILRVFAAGTRGPTIGAALPVNSRPPYASTPVLRIMAGPQEPSADALSTLVSSPYRLKSESNRMGFRLEGQRLENGSMAPAISDGTAMGALQIPPDGQPILLMADRPTTGGYPKAAVVIAADIPLAAQLLPGDALLFRHTTLREAEAAFADQWGRIDGALPPREA